MEKFISLNVRATTTTNKYSKTLLPIYNNDMANSELKNFIKEISNKYNLKKVILFGSRANGTNRDNSDIDLMVEYNTPTVSIFTTVGLMQEIQEKFNVPVDIVRYPLKNRGIKLRIDKEEVLYSD